MSQLKDLKAATSLAGVATLLGFRPAALSYILYKKGSANNYTQFAVPKRGGGVRNISAPTDDLKLLQRRLADLLQLASEELTEEAGRKDAMSHGFKRRRSIITNANRHRKRRYVFNIDLSSFFDSINFGRVRGFFIKDKDFSLPDKVATVVAQIICFQNALPQGSPCSPVVSNLIGHLLDIHLVRLAASCRCTYTRYADDLTFSTGAHDFPSQIAVCVNPATHTWLPGSELIRLITKCGFSINPRKTRMQYRDSRQEVTGLVVNRRVGAKREYRHLVRAMVDKLVRTGNFDVTECSTDASGATVETVVKGTRPQLRGMLGFIESIDAHNRKLEGKSGAAKSVMKSGSASREATYRHFLLFSELYDGPSPFLIGEGPTDTIYLMHAIRARAAGHPKLATIGTPVQLKVRVFKYANAGTARILGLHGGTANLGNLIRSYNRAWKRFKAPGRQHPVILVIDNDKGSHPVISVIKEITKGPITGDEEFIHVTANLYVVMTPKFSDGSHSQMEDFFQEKLKKIVIDGRSFDPSNDTDSNSKYGKMVFAHKVVKAQAGTIDFSGFDPLLTRISSVIETHEKKVAAALVHPGK